MKTVLGKPKTFGVKQAIQLIVSTAARVGHPVDLNSALDALRAAFPDLRSTNTALQRELKRAADLAGALVSSGSQPHRSVVLMPGKTSAGVSEPSKREVPERSLAA